MSGVVVLIVRAAGHRAVGDGVGCIIVVFALAFVFDFVVDSCCSCFFHRLKRSTLSSL